MALWCKDFPVREFAQSSIARPLTLVLPFYENQRFFEKQVEKWHSFSADLRQHLSAIVVDDGSPEPARLPSSLPFPIRLFRIDVDVRWNWLAARNIGMHHARNGARVFLSDMDHVLPEETAEILVYGVPDPRVVYAFFRREHDGTQVTPHSATFFLTKETFWKTGGYDEALSGHYGTDGEFRRRLSRVARIEILPHWVERWEYVDDSSTARYARKQPEDAAVSRLVAARPQGWKPKVLSFPYHEVTREEVTT